ncbi:MAG: tetratricopeptide repeat protein [Chloroflexi bacterium]|nr:tetratricopeptide repeat protein [Chloroflexota bacterium]
MRDQRDPLAPPPRGLMAVFLGLFIVLVLGGIGGLILLQSRPALSSLLQLALVAAVVVTLAVLAAAFAFRRRLPRRTLPALVIVVAALWLLGGAAFVVLYRTAFQPGQRETAKYYLPFLRAFDPPVPAPDTTLPTVSPDQTEAISPADLLSSPFGLATATPEQPAVIQVEPSPTASPTPVPSATPAPTQTAVAQAATEAPAQPTSAPMQSTLQAAAQVRPVSRVLGGFTHVKQTWNNCGPANITMALSYYGWKEGQEVAAAYLKPSKEDKNVSPGEMVAFVNEETGVRALTRIGGSMELLKTFIANGFPVVVESVLDAEAYDWIGHYETVVGYDDSTGVFYIYDSYVGIGEGSGRTDSYADFDRAWQNFNRTFIVLYRQEEEMKVRDILGPLADPLQAAEIAAETARQEALADPGNAFAWFNLGSSLTKLGEYDKAASAFDQARRIGAPWRMTLYQFGPFEAYFNVGRYDDVLALVKANLNNGGEYVEETHYWNGRVLEAQGQKQQASAAFRQALAHNPRFTAAKDALDKLNL